MKRVYLDQNKWIDLAAAEHGSKRGESYRDTHLLLRATVEAGDVSLPLSSAHYIETANRRDWDSRRKLALVMASFSHLHTIAPGSALIPGELDRAMQQAFGRPDTLLPMKPFGHGLAHAFDRGIEPYRVPPELASYVADRWGVERGVNYMRELVMLTGLPPEAEEKLPGFKPLSHLPVAEQYARDKEELRQARQAAGWNKGEKAARVAAAEAFTDHEEQLNAALERAQVSATALYDLGAEGMTAFLRTIPTIFTASELERLRHTASQKEWERQDLTDITALGVAAVHCDVVVTERFWVEAAKRARLGHTYNTVFLRRLEDLPQHLL